MAISPTTPIATCLTLDAVSAADLMISNPISIRDEATIQEAIALLTDRGIGAAPVINAASRPIGVISRADILIHQREQPAFAAGAQPMPGQDPTRVRDLMTPAVFSVHPDTPAVKVVQETAAMNVQQLFVVDHDGVLIGVIRALDILKRLHPSPISLQSAFFLMLRLTMGWPSDYIDYQIPSPPLVLRTAPPTK